MPAIAQFLVNGAPGSAAGERAERVADAIDGPTVVTYRNRGRLADAWSMAREVRRVDPSVVFSMDLALTPSLAWLIAGRRPMIVDTGDTPRHFLDLIGASLPARWLASALEDITYGGAQRIIVRGEHHRTQLEAAGHGHVSVIPDGVDHDLIRPVDVSTLRRQLGIDDVLTVGVQGNFTWFPQLGGGIGWDLIEALGRRPDLNAHAVLIGDGPGIAQLRVLADRHGIADRVHVVGRVPYAELPRYLSLCDVTLLTQTNDPSSWARTTGKLPTYLASGRHVLSSRVGTAADLLPNEHLIDYVGYWDDTYPDRLGQRIAELESDLKATRAAGDALRPLSRSFDYDDIAAQLADEVMTIAGAR